MVSFTIGVHCWPLSRRSAWRGSALRKTAERTPHGRRSGNLKWCSREDSHLEPPPSQSGMQNSYTSGAIRRASLHSACSWPAAATCRSVATPTQISQPLEITSDERVFFRARPLLDLRFSATRFCKVSVKFDEQNFDGWIKRRCATCRSLGVGAKACFRIIRAADIKRARTKSKNVNE